MAIDNNLKSLIMVLQAVQYLYKDKHDIPLAINLYGGRTLALKSICIDDSDPSEVPTILFEADLEEKAESLPTINIYSQTGNFEGRTDSNRLNSVSVANIRELAYNEEIQRGDFLQVLSLDEYEEEGEEITELIEKFAGKMVEVLGVSRGINEFGECEFMVQDNEGNVVTMTSHEFNKAYRQK